MLQFNHHKFPHAIIWSATAALLVILALVLPSSVNTDLKSLSESSSTNELTIFSSEIIALNEKLNNDKPIRLSDEDIQLMRPYLQARRLAEAGPLIPEENTQALAILKDFELAISQQDSESAKRALRTERNKQLDKVLSRLSEDVIAKTLKPIDELQL